MRPIHLVKIDRLRPAVILTREPARERMSKVTVAPITSRIKGLKVEVPVGARNGLDHDCVVSCDNITTVSAAAVGRFVGFLLDSDEVVLTRALVDAFDLSVEELP